MLSNISKLEWSVLCIYLVAVIAAVVTAAFTTGVVKVMLFGLATLIFIGCIPMIISFLKSSDTTSNGQLPAAPVPKAPTPQEVKDLDAQIADTANKIEELRKAKEAYDALSSGNTVVKPADPSGVPVAPVEPILPKVPVDPENPSFDPSLGGDFNSRVTPTKDN